MSHAMVFACLLSAALPAFSKGISVRFLANPSGDSVSAYRILRAQGPGEPVAVGEVSAAAGGDTLSFADTGAARGRAYIYSIVAVDAAGEASEPSGATAVGLPLLALPDTLRAGPAGIAWELPAGADPLTGSAALSLSLEDSSRFALRFDSASRRLVFEARGNPAAGWAVLRAVYYGKFADRDSVWIDLAPAASIAPRAGSGAEPAWSLPSRWSPRLGPLSLRSPQAGSGATWTLLTPRGEAIATVVLPKSDGTAAWDGRDARGRTPAPAAYLWAMRRKGGALLRAGSLRIDP